MNEIYIKTKNKKNEKIKSILFIFFNMNEIYIKTKNKKNEKIKSMLFIFFKKRVRKIKNVDSLYSTFIFLRKQYAKFDV